MRASAELVSCNETEDSHRRRWVSGSDVVNPTGGDLFIETTVVSPDSFVFRSRSFD